MKEVIYPEKEVEYKASVDDKGNVVLKKKEKIRKGKKARQKGGSFELKVRKDLEEKKWIVSKWSENVDLEKNILIIAKRKFNPFSKALTLGTGFPDFLAFQKMNDYYKVVGVECKINGLLSKIEKEKCAWLLKNGIFNEIWIAKKSEKEIEYINFSEKWKKFLE